MQLLLVLIIVGLLFLFHRSVWRLHGTPKGLLVRNIAIVGSLALLAGAFAAALMGTESICCTLFIIAIFLCWPLTAMEGEGDNTRLAAPAS